MHTTRPIETGTHNTRNSDHCDAGRIAETINSAVHEGRTVHLNGREVWARFGEPATTWGSGSVSVETRSLRQAGKSATAWIKSGDRCEITIGDAPTA